MALTDLTRISTSGIATGTSLSGAILHGDAHFRGTQVGVTSALFDSSDDALEFNDNVKLKLGNNGDLEVYHASNHSYLENSTGELRINNTSGSDMILNSTGRVQLQVANGEKAVYCDNNGSVELYFNGGDPKFKTTNHGAIVTGILTATSFSGPTNNTSGIATFYDLRVSNNLTVEGTTTTLDTNLIGVDRVEVGANSNSVVGVAITQSGTADIVNLFDGATKVVTVDDVGKVGIGSEIPSSTLDVAGGAQFKTNGAAVKIESSTGTNFTQLQLINSGGSFYVGRENSAGDWFQSGTGYASVLRSDGAYPLIFRVNSDNRLRITSGGELQVGSAHTTSTNYGWGPVARFQIETANDPSSIHFGQRAGGSADPALVFLRRGGSTSWVHHAARIYYDTEKFNFETAAPAAPGSHSFGKRMVIKHNGNIGIGTDDPDTKLEVFAGTDSIQVGNQSGSGRFGADGTSTKLGSHSNHHLDLFTNGSSNTRLRITSGGTVGINDSSPNTYFKLDVNGHTNIVGDVALPTTNRIYFGNSDTSFIKGEHGASAYLAFGANNEKMRLTRAGNLGIGTDNPNHELTVYGDEPNFRLTHTGSTNQYNALYTQVDGTGVEWNSYQDGTGTRRPFIFKQYTTEVLRIASDGKITHTNFSGIGLHMSGGSDPTIRVQDTDGTNQYGDFAHNAGDTYIVTRNNTTHGEFVLYSNNGSATSTRLKIDLNGKILTYTTGAESSQFSTTNSGGAYQQYDLGASGANIGYIGAGSLLVSASATADFGIRAQANMVFSSGGAVERLRIASTGNIGIANVSPQEKLQITGNISLGNRSDGASRYIGKGTNGSGGVIGDASANPNSGWIGFVSGSGTGAEDQIRFGTLKSGTSGGERMRLDGLGRLSIGAALGTHNDPSEFLKIQQNTASAVLSIIGSNDTHSTLALGDEDDFNIQKIRSDHTDNKLQFYTNNTERLILQNGGVLSQRVGSNARLSHGILEITSSSSPTQLKIKTNIAYSGSSSHAESVTIRGFRYGGRDTVDLQICWHVYAGQFYNRIASSSGAWAPLITLAVENNKVVIHFDSLGYWHKIYVSDYYSAHQNEDYARGWSYDFTAISGDAGLPVNTVPYKNDWGGLTYNDDHNVGTNPDRHLKIVNGNLQIGTAGHGIDFSVTGNGNGTMASELLDDYEEGSWTPDPHFATTGSAGETALSDGGLQGQYVKIGRLVYYTFSINFTSRSGSASGNFYVSGLPYNISNNYWNEENGFPSAYYTGLTNSTGAPSTQPSNPDRLFFAIPSSTGSHSSNTYLNHNDIGTGNIRIRGGGIYRTAT